MNDKYISNQKSYITLLFKQILDMEITEDNFKCYKGDLAVFFRHKGRDLYLCYDEYKDMFLLYHLNECQNPSKSTRYHIQRYEKFLPLIFAYLETCHNWASRLEKTPKSRMEQLFDTIEQQRVESLEKKRQREQDEQRRKQLLEEIHAYHESK